jgi:hypothetical protein
VRRARSRDQPADKLVDLVQSLRLAVPAGRGVRDEFVDAPRDPQVQDERRRVLFQPSLAAGRRRPARLSGVEAEDMPDIRGEQPVDRVRQLQGGYVIAERNSTTILRDPLHAQPYVHFYATPDFRSAWGCN